MSEEIKFTVNGTELEAKSGELLIEACENSGIHIPRFCWHKRLDPVGMCRMCLVEIETPRGKMLVPSCTTEVTDEMVVDTESEVVKKAQEGVLEFLLITQNNLRSHDTSKIYGVQSITKQAKVLISNS